MTIADLPIPVYTALSNLYDNIGTTLDHAPRWDSLVKEFEKRFGRKPKFVARAPGRVNLIGEHIDYALFGVLPAAIEQDILIACAPRIDSTQSPGTITADNLNPKYTRQVFTPTPNSSNIWHLDINTQELRWESYVKAGYYGVLSHYFPNASTNLNTDSEKPVSADILVIGTVPPGAGVSSSAAMVVASTLAFLAVNGKLETKEDSNLKRLVNKGDLVRMSMENEKRVGVNSGGMDQAASILSSPASALYITFHPKLSASPVPLPKDAVLVCANSLVVSDKAVTAKTRYNLRVVETLVGARILANILNVKIGEKEKVTYKEVLGRWLSGKGKNDDGEDLKWGLEEILNRLECLKTKDEGLKDEESGVKMDEMIKLSGLTDEIFQEVYLSWVDVEAERFQLYKRAKHVFSEALRVLEFQSVCLSSSSSSSSSTTTESLQTLGTLMNQSHTSCSTLFECSCPELDLLTSIALEAGAYGSRLTGAGWGGCSVSLIPEDKVDVFVETLMNKYPPYLKFKELDLSEEERKRKMKEAVFVTRPGTGAFVFKFE